MVKTTKRARKFLAKGGVQAGLKKGSISKKGKIRGVRRPKKDGEKNNTADKSINKTDELLTDREIKRRENDFLSNNNLKDLDMDSFFDAVTATTNHDDGEGENLEDDSKNNNLDEEMSDSDSDGDSSEDEEEDIEEAERKMKEKLEKLESDDPEFHKFLKHNESSLLEFNTGDGANMDEEDGDDDDKDSEDVDMEKDEADETITDHGMEEEEEEDGGAKNSGKLTLSKLDRFEESALEAHGLKGLKRLVQAYKTACHLSDTDRDDHRVKTSFHIESSVVFDRLMVVCLSRLHEAFRWHLVGEGSGKNSKENKKEGADPTDDDDMNGTEEESIPLNPNHLMKSKSWAKVKLILQTFHKSTVHLLNEVRESKLLSFILRCLTKYIPFLTPFPNIAKSLLKCLVSHWSAPFQSEKDHVVRLHAFLRIRQLALTQPFPFIEDCLKALYLSYAKSAKFVTETSLPTLTFMGNCLVELYSIDIDSSYQHAFIYIRQLALHLRSALQKKTKESFQVVYCWQYLYCLKLWTSVLSANPAENELRSLVYPLTEIILGVSRLLPTTRHLPIRLHCVRLLQQLASSVSMFIPTTPILFEALDLKELYMKPKKKKMKNGKSPSILRLPLVLKLPKDDTLRTADQLEPCVSEIFVLLNREVDLYRYSVGFPEFSIQICQRLRKVS